MITHNVSHFVTLVKIYEQTPFMCVVYIFTALVEIWFTTLYYLKNRCGYTFCCQSHNPLSNAWCSAYIEITKKQKNTLNTIVKVNYAVVLQKPCITVFCDFYKPLLSITLYICHWVLQIYTFPEQLKYKI